MVLRLLVAAAVLAFLFRAQIGNGFTVLLGDAYDGLIQASLMQHWDNALHGLEPWDTPSYFFPHPDTLGYSEGFFLNGMLLAGFRSLGADMLLADELGTIVIRAIGFFAFEAFAADVLAFGFGWAVLGAAVFSLSTNVVNQSMHAQLLSVSLAPLLGWLLWRALQALQAGTGLRAVAWGVAAALLYGAWLLSGVYTSWFTLLFLTAVIVAAVLMECARAGAGWTAWRVLWSWPVAPVLVALAAACTPFVMVYWPKLRETGGQVFAATEPYSPSLPDLLHTGSYSWLFGWLDQWLTQALRPGFADYGEHTIGLQPVIAVLAVLGGLLALRGRAGPRPVLMRAIALGTALCFVLVLHVGSHTLWFYVWRFFPGGSAVRVTARFVLLLSFPVTLLAVAALRARAASWPRWLVGLLALVLVLEELTAYQPNGLDRPAELARLAATPPPPPGCQTFFVSTGPGRPPIGVPILDALYPHNVDAMVLAASIALPTINGFATFNPPDWNFASIELPDYPGRVQAYLNAHDLHRGICKLDLARHVWAAAGSAPLPVVAFGETIGLGPGGDAGGIATEGWDAPERSGQWGIGRWANRDRAELEFTAPDAPGDLLLRLDAASFARPGRMPVPVTVTVNGRLVAVWHPAAGEQTLQAVLPRPIIGPDRQMQVMLAAAPPPRLWPLRPPKRSMRIGLFVRALAVVAIP